MLGAPIERRYAMTTRTIRPEPAAASGLATRLAIRRGVHIGTTAGLAPGFTQANLAILPRAFAADFLSFCELNPKPCPLIGVGTPGDFSLPALGDDIDLRTDLPRYRVWCDGALVDEPTEISRWWRDDLVSFAIGCSFSFEQALIEAGLEIRHITRGCNVPMYRTSLATSPSGRFHGPLVVSMRPFAPAHAIRAIEITGRFPKVHGAPIHIGKPDLIGITDIAAPDYGDAVPVGDDELPVFWACGVTPQAAIANARPDLCITHYPGAMLVTDRRNVDFTAS
jgi:uncharacterized protein YcsI (UPF0317 family)